jgi:glucose 1-dehydrogenase
LNDSTAPLQGRVAFVTGAASGIGAAIAVSFARAGAKVALAVRSDDERAQKTLAATKTAGAQGFLTIVDVCDEAAIDRSFDDVTKQLGRPTILVNGAGVDALGKNVADMELSEWERALRTNLTGPFLCTRAFLRGLGSDGAGAKIINISSVHEEIPRAGAAEYCASKGGLRNLTRALALELAPRKITINGIAPGMILTPMNQADIDAPAKLKTDEKTIPLQRAGRPEEIAELALFLASSSADYVTGSTYVMDGGLMQNTGQGALSWYEGSRCSRGARAARLPARARTRELLCAQPVRYVPERDIRDADSSREP